MSDTVKAITYEELMARPKSPPVWEVKFAGLGLIRENMPPEFQQFADYFVDVDDWGSAEELFGIVAHLNTKVWFTGEISRQLIKLFDDKLRAMRALERRERLDELN